LRNTSDGIHIVSADGVLLEASDSFFAMLGYTREEAIGMKVRDWDVALDDGKLTEMIRRRAATNERILFETRHRRKDGSVIDVEIAGCSLELDGRRVLYNSSRDISERKRLELEAKRFAAIVQSSDDAIISKSLAGIVTSWNRGAQATFGYSAEEMIGKPLRVLFPRERREEEQAILARILLGETVTHFETVRLRKDGSRVDVSVTISPIRDSDGRVVGASKIARDITRRKQTEAELERHRKYLEDLVDARTSELSVAKKAAEAASVAKSAFLANMSHEIRTPMNTIIGMANILRRAGVASEHAEKLDKIDLAGRHLLEVINAILDLSKIEAGKFVLDEAEVRVETIVANVASMLSERARDKGLKLIVKAEAPAAALLGDATRLQQALLNYATNAIKFTETGEVVLRVGVESETADSALVRFAVEDTGIGIAAEAARRLFVEFEQVDNSTTRKYGGTGLGLAVTRRFAESMGGSAGVDSVPGRGSTFWFTAQLKKGASVTAPGAGTGELAEAIIRRDFSGSRVLLVEDEPINQQVTLLLLEDTGLVFDVADDGAVAIEMAARTPYDLILMDMQMPTVGGLEATRRIRESNARVPIVATTANAFAEDKARCLAAGMNDFIAKPFAPADLFATILRWLEATR
jgi:PAS domain S-box-containing protein